MGLAITITSIYDWLRLVLMGYDWLGHDLLGLLAMTVGYGLVL